MASLAELEVPRLIYVLGAAIAVVGLLGALNAGITSVPAFALQGEVRAVGFNAPTLMTGFLGLLSAAFAVRCASLEAAAGRRSWPGRSRPAPSPSARSTRCSSFTSASRRASGPVWCSTPLCSL
jgi:hypothetical protein